MAPYTSDAMRCGGPPMFIARRREAPAQDQMPPSAARWSSGHARLSEIIQALRASKSCSAHGANLGPVHRRLTVAIVRVEEGHRRDDAGSCAALACRVVLLARKLLPSIRIEVLTSDLAVSNRRSDILPRRMADSDASGTGSGCTLSANRCRAACRDTPSATAM